MNQSLAHLRSKRRGRWGWALRVLAGPSAASSASGCGRTRASGLPAHSAASCASLWTAGSGTTPETRAGTQRDRYLHAGHLQPRRSWRRHFDRASICIVERNGGGGWDHARALGDVDAWINMQTSKQTHTKIHVVDYFQRAVHTRPRVIRRNIYFGTCTEPASEPRRSGEERAQLPIRQRATHPTSLMIF